MKTASIRVGICGTALLDHRGSQIGTEYQIDVLNHRYTDDHGISSDGNYSGWDRLVTVMVPDWVAPSPKWRWDMSRPGYKSRSGSGDMCFVSCKTPAKFRQMHGDGAGRDFGEAVQAVIDGGFRLHYPIEDGSMATMDIEQGGADGQADLFA